jgi:hypothetical protein
MSPEEELATAVADREHWQLWGRVAVHTRPGAACVVHVRALARPTRTIHFAASIVRGDRRNHGTASWWDRTGSGAVGRARAAGLTDRTHL